MSFRASLILSMTLLILGPNLNALEYSKIDFEGCPENSFCKKETGANRKKWLEELKKFTKNSISEQTINEFVQSEYGLPISSWAQEDASLQPNILMWDSPCKQHQGTLNKFYISEFFRKNLAKKELSEFRNLFFSRAVMFDNKNQAYSMIVPRGDAPLFIKDGSLYYLREEEGYFYGLLIDRDGRLRVTKAIKSPELPKEAVCSKDLTTLFMREAPGANFYQGQFCKDIWDTTLKSYRTVLLGWSCN